MKNNFFSILDILVVVLPALLLGVYLVSTCLERLFRLYYCSMCFKELERHAKNHKTTNHTKKGQVLKCKRKK